MNIQMKIKTAKAFNPGHVATFPKNHKLAEKAIEPNSVKDYRPCYIWALQHYKTYLPLRNYPNLPFHPLVPEFLVIPPRPVGPSIETYQDQYHISHLDWEKELENNYLLEFIGHVTNLFKYTIPSNAISLICKRTSGTFLLLLQAR